MMTVTETSLPLVLEIIPQIFSDERGFFLETFNEKEFAQWGIKERFVQDNQSVSKKGVLRGMHYQKGSSAQGKLVRVVRGAVFDVAADVRRDSPSFGKWYGTVLNPENKKMLWVPPGFAHGFLSLEEGTIFQYKCTAFYDPKNEEGFVWDDPFIAIDWRLKEFGIHSPVLSEKDKRLPNISK